jgi:hypothetical protein
MERVMPKKILEARSVKDMQMIGGLPLIALMRNGNNITIYKIKDTNGYIDSWDDHLMPSYESLEEASKNFGEVISEEQILQASITPPNWFRYSEEKEVALCRAKFPEKTCDAKSKICR